MFPTPSETFPTAYHESLGEIVGIYGTGYGSGDCSLEELHGYIALVFGLRLEGRIKGTGSETGTNDCADPPIETVLMINTLFH
jgi:hypothetical protein